MKSFFRLPEASVVITAVLLILFFSIGTHGLWLRSLPSILRLTAQLGIVAIGQALLITSGEVDLSVGSVFAITGVVFITAMDQLGFGIAPAMLLALLVASAIGLLNATLTVGFRVPSMVVTLGAMFAFRGITYLTTQGHSLSIPRELRTDPIVLAVKTRIFDLNGAVLLLVILTAAGVFLFSKMRFGIHIQAVGGNAAAALANGVSPGLVKMRAFIVCSLLAGLSGVMVVCQEGSVYSTSGVKMELETIAAAVIGGCSLRGGVGSVWGPVLGVFILASLKGGLMLMGAPTSWYSAFVGAILVTFLIATTLLRRLGEAR